MTQTRRPVPQRPQQTRQPMQPQRRAAAQARPAQRNTGGFFSRLPNGTWKLALGGIVFIALFAGLQWLWPNGFSVAPDRAKNGFSGQVAVIHSSGSIRINELMASNVATAVDENGETADWIEIANVGAEPVNLYGYALAKNEKAANVFRFPDYVLEGGQCVLVFADSVLKDNAGQAFHAPFRLNAQGGSVMLFNRKGNAIDSVNFPAIPEDMSYARVDSSSWETTSMATPGALNTPESYEMLHTPRTDGGVEITEVVASNSKYAPDENGAYQDYFELHNTSGVAIDLSGWFVSDDASRAMRWRLPEGFAIDAGGYRIVYASGLNRSDSEYPHSNFGLSSEGEDVVLSDASGHVVDSVHYGLLKKDTAYLKQADGSWSVGAPTPGAP
ncbi:MAG: lamin tail domain-containing protein [Clostridia bacterium]|nr:lamin tail domain-containing protein [Clostridia bacterium]